MRRTVSALVLLGFGAALSGGCASSFRYDSDDAPPPPPLTQPTTMPSRDVANTDSFRGMMRSIFIDLPTRAWEYAQGDTPSARAAALEDSKLPDRRRQGIDLLSDYAFGRQAPYTTRYKQVAQFDADGSVRATAIRALNRSRDGSATGAFIAGLDDGTPAVRLESAKALSNVPDTAAVPGLLKVFRDAQQPIDVRIAAADALRQYRSLEIARALVNVLADREFSLAWQARQSLRTMTGGDKRYDQSAWLEYLTGNEKPLG
ncbi:MAG: HEAT repeat domain-containing protein [Tepidisphaeraceae bacterium]